MNNRDKALQSMIDDTKVAILETDGELNQIAARLDCNRHQAWLRIKQLGLTDMMIRVKVKAEERFRMSELSKPRKMSPSHFYSEEALE